MGRPPTPIQSSHFSVDLGVGKSLGFSEVIFPPFEAARESTADAAPAPVLVRRAVSASRELYDWWDEARNQRAKLRTVTVSLLGPNGKPVLAWRFLGTRPLWLAYSPLSAASAQLATETLAFAFERVELG
jgi:phage tail-like protein